ncbi:MAG: ABC transporter permease [Deltaproteobacteria bacterium]|nr:ABC transporter permease [Deltaproteobacteria bacterium]MCL5792997.1 ABC transporter permease [Deltaproteobacteria bacterium]
MKRIAEHFKDLYRYRALISALVIRGLKARYRGSVLGFFWTFINPFLLMLVYVFVFKVLMKNGMKNYSVFLFAGLLPWTWFSTALTDGVNSIVSGSNLITKVLFPPQVLPTVSVLVNMMNYIFSLPLLFLFIFILRMNIGISIIAVIPVIIIQLILTEGLVLIIAAINVYFRDLQQIVSNFLLLGFFVTPIIYQLTQVPSRYLFILYTNPMTLLVRSYQWIFYYDTSPNWLHLSYLLAASFIVLFTGVYIFEKLKEAFPEFI